MKEYAILIFLILATSCSGRIDYLKTNDGVAISPTPIKILDTDVVGWKVGPRLKQRLSKGVFVRFELPMFKRDDLQDLVINHEVDSWLIRVRKQGLGSSKILKRVFVPFTHQGSKNSVGNIYVSQQNFVSFSIFYKAASRQRWSKRSCPPFKHNSLIEDIDIKSPPDASRVLMVKKEKRSRKNYIDSINPYSFSDQTVDAGQYMKGEYYLEIALFNSVKKQRRTEFYDVGDHLHITEEVSVNIKGCENFEPKNYDNSDVINKFQFGG